MIDQVLQFSKEIFLKRTIISFLAMIFLVGGCTWVKLSEEANMVALVSKNDVVSCQKLGTTTSKVLDKVAFLKRSKTKQNEELTTLAKNEAVKMGGDTIVVEGEIEDGRQKFLVYQCGEL
ncbi:MAG: DUF4156 domain-containing protein [Cellvibrionaceae bacterium]